MTTRSDRLRAHIDAAQGAPVVGVNDCGPWVAAWIAVECGKPVVFPPYKTSEEAYALAAQAGGLVEFVTPLLAAIPLWETGAPLLGDVGIIRLSDRDTAVIFCGNGISVVRDEHRATRFIHPRTILKAWTVP